GTGYFSRFHFDAWSRLDGVRLVGAASLDRKGLAGVREEFSVNATFGDVGAMLDQTRPDLLDIAAPPGAHQALLEAAASRGIDVICQKPLGGDLETARAMVERAEAAGITFAVHENFRFQPWYREAKRVMDDGLLGEITNISFRLRPGDGQGPRAYLDRQPYFQTMERFLIHETAIHLVDSFRYLMGEVSGVFARLRRLNPAITGEDAGYLLFAFASGADGLFDGNRLIGFAAENPRLTMGELLVEGTGGGLRLDGEGNLWRRSHDGPEKAHAYAWENRGFGGDCVFALQRHVLAHLRDGEPLENGGRDYLANLEVEDLIYRSAESGRFLSLTDRKRDR
ncbi:MAG: Gfo/Idh/MocA family oxidoreductase, partial [Alphaproteobacteria bacterium]|nr:Gfo/Idh/MocA family oxidoreductase [Alphaproteobacteria bacterium]